MVRIDVAFQGLFISYRVYIIKEFLAPLAQNKRAKYCHHFNDLMSINANTRDITANTLSNATITYYAPQPQFAPFRKPS